MIKYDREKHVQLITVEPEALASPAVLRLAADMGEQLGLVMSSEYDGLRFYRDKSEEELAADEQNRIRGAELLAEGEAKREQAERERAAEWGISYEEYLTRKRLVRGY